ncbi:hypothetical protein HBH56_157500 [Parastagonospora nodorum]|uniref:Uncharacterized protein n=1 Tax=Phaeosphaeria nodorum (strain SN15 / ATCC MYA-4574 / FGSC 10173) TaxID=321614 RepID=A0A7U2I2I3_PHANO|nr:hypothetical protein HBH56_157500 [Parastagonospora nodorum]QRC97456.1 hypothetical protein JI435_410570 [Parastagonospora nodorum SN15]KAH3922913.1 hypothetical protein HBH54_217240 [Parastagonospora nodorum]KAH4050372.1 hypothetical protein HBH49_131650 [Parastagonospora nodorum]KAH4127516.1 hypothetical protein HBH45_215230 [Parastagonospora nodorum]
MDFSRQSYTDAVTGKLGASDFFLGVRRRSGDIGSPRRHAPLAHEAYCIRCCMHEGYNIRGAFRPVAFTRQAADISSSCSVISIIQDGNKTPYRVIVELPNSPRMDACVGV